MSLFRNLRLLTKVNLIIAIVIVLFFLLSAFFIYRQQENMAIEEAVDKARIIASEAINIREYLSDEYLSGNVELNADRYGLIPVVAANRINELVADDLAYRIRQVSNRYRNPKNATDSFEKKALEKFRENPAMDEYYAITESEGESVFRYLTPFVVDSSCLECHGKPEEAPEFIREIFPPETDQAYNYRIGEIIGAASVSIPMQRLDQIIATRLRNNMMFVGGIFIALVICLNLLIRIAVSRPLGLLGQALSNIVRTGRMTEKVPIKAGGEIGALIDGFNEMIDELGEKTRHLEESEKRYRLLAESASDSIISFLPNGQVILFNSRAEKELGYNKREVLGMNIDRFVHESCEEFHEYGAAEFLSREKDRLLSEKIKVPIRYRGGRKMMMRLSLSVATSEDYSFYTAILQDVDKADSAED